MIKTIDVSHVPYYAWDRDEALKFFVEVFGFDSQIRGNTYYAAMGDVLIELFKREAPEAESIATDYVFGVQVPDVEQSLEELTSIGVKVLRELFVPVSFYGHQAVIGVPGGPPIAIRDYRDGDGPKNKNWTPRPKE